MNIRYYKILLIFIASIFCQPCLAQSIEDTIFQSKSLLSDKYGSSPETKNPQIPTSESQITPNFNDLNNVDLPFDQSTGTSAKQSLLNRYFKALSGQSLNIYGSNQFKRPQDNNLLFFNTIGRNYKLAPGDVIQVIITGLSPSNSNHKIMNDGTINLENIYPITINNMTLDQVDKLILDKIKIDDASAEVFVRLNTARLVTVQISGNVNYPRTIAVPAYTPLSRVIAYSGGVSDSGSLRNIVLSEIGEQSQTVDFYDFLQNPSSVTDPLIKSGARIFVPNIGATIAAVGFVNNPGIYELPSDKSEIIINDLLNITGTSFLPFGATLKVSYIDSFGQIATRLVRKNDRVNEGEVLNVEFIETRDLNISKIYGAVLSDYEIKTNAPLSIKEVIKNGAVLRSDIYKSFALIIGKDVQAINLNNALEDDAFTLPVGSDLQLFTKEEYLKLVSEDANKLQNNITTELAKAKNELAKAKNIVEIYLDGVRVAIVPVNHDQVFSEVVKNSYVSGPKTIFDVALIENDSVIHAVDLKTEISKQDQRKLNNGDRLFIFEDKFYDTILKEIILERKMQASTITPTTFTASDNTEVILLQKKLQDEEEEYVEAIRYSKRILQRANLINIKLDGELFTYLPYIEGISSSYILEKLRNRLPKLVSEFAVVQNINTGKTPQVKNLNNPFEIGQGEELNLISNMNYHSVIKDYDDMTETNLLTELKSSNAVKVYYDGRLVLLLPPNYRPSELKLFEQYTKNNDLYKLYVGLDTTDLENGTWNLLTFGSEEFFSDTNNLILGPSNVVNLFSNNFIKNEFISDKANINGVNFNINTNPNFKKNTVDTTKASIPRVNLTNDDTLSAMVNSSEDLSSQEDSTSNRISHLNTHIEIMRNSLRTISGSVQFPGAYPVAKKILLSNFLSTAGLIEQTAKSGINITEAINQEDRLARVNPKTIKINDVNLNNIVLSGLYHLDIPLSINDGITGVIELKGEVLIPGKYSFTRSEKIQDIIKRAGGLSDVAFPLGAKLHRVSAKELEKNTNNILADQLEASILNLAQSSLEGAGDQVKVVLGYANQLRSQSTEGRMAVNILDNNPSNPIFLEDGDILTVPKRPSHVSVVGSVQRSTLATYVPGQDYNDYIQFAGGATKVADIRKAYLLLPNGESRQLNKTTVIPVGSTIIIPPKLDRLSILGGTDIISKVLNNISQSVLSIKNVD